MWLVRGSRGSPDVTHRALLSSGLTHQLGPSSGPPSVHKRTGSPVLALLCLCSSTDDGRLRRALLKRVRLLNGN
jgi:hypothetical protein